MDCDYLIVGAGFAGLVFAEQACARGKRCVVVDKRPHIGGNCRDEFDEHGVLIHTYGPHYFRTNSERILEYLSRFTEWRPARYAIKSWTGGRFWSFPINLNTFEQLIGRAATSEEFERWLEEHRIPHPQPANSEEVILDQVGREFYELFFKGYTLKQWKRHPRELDASVCGRVPMRTNREDSCLSEKYQVMPKDGYSRLFQNLVEACGDRLTLRLNTDYRELLGEVCFARMVYTGPIDAFYDYRFGPLPYRSLRFEREHVAGEALRQREPLSGKPGHWQPAVQVNYPNDEEFTRIVEVKHVTGQQHEGTTLVREYPAEFGPDTEPYYPVPNPDSAALYQRYKELADQDPGTIFIGRLATYRYYNMDQVVGMALAAAEKEFG